MFSFLTFQQYVHLYVSVEEPLKRIRNLSKLALQQAANIAESNKHKEEAKALKERMRLDREWKNQNKGEF